MGINLPTFDSNQRGISEVFLSSKSVLEEIYITNPQLKFFKIEKNFFNFNVNNFPLFGFIYKHKGFYPYLEHSVLAFTEFNLPLEGPTFYILINIKLLNELLFQFALRK